MKKILTFVTVVFTLICMALPAFAEEAESTTPSPRRLDVQLVQVSLRDSGNTVHQNNLYDGSSFFLNIERGNSAFQNRDERSFFTCIR